MGRVIYGPRQREHTLDTLERVIARFRRDDELLAARHGHQHTDGYPTASLGGGGRGGTADPTGRAAAIRIDHPAGDLIGTHVERAWALIHQAARILEEADSHRARALPPEADAHDDDAEWCLPHLRAGICTPRDKAGRCRWCYEFSRAHGQDPPPELVIKYHDRGRVYDADVRQALTRDRRRHSRRA